ncbi:MAG TPA: fused MFS/spermidine synthase [Polyangiaceae bacterium]|nr:fused MFS/spermidine synthase [Polyangiaceae bacterium]
MEENAGPAQPMRTHTVLLLLFVASGCAALIYEIVWFHLLRLVIGASALSLGILLASFMGGMFLGSLLLARIVPRTAEPLRVYGLIEIGIGAFGIALPFLLPGVRAIYFGLFGHGLAGIALRGVVAALILLPPTALMGATLPAVARRYRGNRSGPSALAELYGANTLGAVLGCLWTGFYILPNWDILVATGIAAALNLLIGITALRLARRPAVEAAEPVEADAPAPVRDDARIVYGVVALSGLTALGAQVVWTRLLALIFGGTIYTFAIILAVFLGGLGAGSALAAWALRRGHDSRRLLAASQLGLVPAIVYAAFMIATILPYTSTLRVVPIRTLHTLHVIRCMEVILPAAVLWGMSFPLALAAASAASSDQGRSSGNVYAANTFGAIVGSLATSLLLIPSWGTRTAEQIFVVLAAISASLMYASIRRPLKKNDQDGAKQTAAPAEVPAEGATADKKTAGQMKKRKRTRLDVLAELPLPLAIVGVLLVPALPAKFQAIGRYIWTLNDRDKIPYVAEGVASTVAVRESSNHRYYHVAGKVEASTDALDMRLQRLLGHLSALAHPHPESVLVVGLGAGVTAGAFVVHPEVKRIVICEIEPAVLPAASRYFSQQNHNVLSDARVEVVSDDARHFLATTHEKFDIITSDPIHPWVRGNSVLFSQEYYAIVKDKLNQGGIATQWVPLYETSEKAIQIQMRTFVDAFPDGTVFNSQPEAKGYDVVLLGQVEPLRIDIAAVQHRIDDNQALRQSLAEVKLTSALDIFASYGTRGRELGDWLKETPVNRDFSLKLEYISGLAFNFQLADEIYASMIKGRTYPEDIFFGPDEIITQLRGRLAPKARPAAK